MLSKHQSGFCPGDSCIYQLLAITQDICASFDSNSTLKHLIEFGTVDYYSNWNKMELVVICSINQKLFEW